MISRFQRLQGGLLGLLVGDALGVPYEFHAPDRLPPKAHMEFEPPPDFSRAHVGVPPGTWSDDGAQALCLLASLLENDGFDADDFGDRLVQWYEQGYMAVDNHVFDVGITSASAIRAIRRGVPALDAGPNSEHDNGNGSLMRVLPLALWHRGSDAELVSLAHTQSRVTHGHLRSQICCALYCLWARSTLNGSDDAWSESVQTLRDLYQSNPAATEELQTKVLGFMTAGGSGYVVDCLHSARRAMNQSTFEGVVKSAIALGHDTDTTACVAGGLAGIRDGIDAIPVRWRDGLRGQVIVMPLLQQLIDHAM